MSPEKAFTQQQKDAMVAAIKQAEKDTSGEIRVHIENRSKIDVLDRAADVFAHLNMHKTGAKKRCTDLRGLTRPQIRDPWRCRD